MARNLALADHIKRAHHALASVGHPLRQAEAEARTVLEVATATRIAGWVIRLDAIASQMVDVIGQWDGTAEYTRAQEAARAALDDQRTTNDTEGAPI